MLNLASLEQAFATITSVGKCELTVPVKGLPVTLRTLTGKELADAQEYSIDLPEDATNQMQMLERFKIHLLATSIVQVGTLDLRNVKSIETGEVSDTGVAIRVPKHQAVRKILEGWTHGTTLALYQKFLELNKRADAETDAAIQYDITDLDAEIQRIEARLAKLKAERESIQKTKESPSYADLVGFISQAETARVNTIVQAAGERVSILPQPRPPESQSPPEPRPLETRTRITPPNPTPPVPPPQQVQAPITPPASSRDSFGFDEADLEAENARLMALRRGVVSEPDVIPAQVSRTVPHREALNLSDALVDTGAGDIRVARIPPSDDGVETYRMESAPIIARPAPTPVPINSDKNTGSRNPRFRR